MKVLVTGGAGLVGMALRKGLSEGGHQVVGVDITSFGRYDPKLLLMPLSDHAGLERLVVENEIEAVIHGGGISGPVMAKDQPVTVTETNVISTAVLLDIARRHGLRRFLLLSSHVVYGETGPDLVVEDRSLHPSTTYAASKVAGEALVESFRREWGLSGASLRLTRVYGAHRRANCFLRQILLDSVDGRTTVIPCERNFLYHYLYVDDVVGAVVACLAAPQLRHAAYNVTSGEVVTMVQVHSLARTILPNARVELTDGADDAPEVQADFSLERIAADTGWSPQFPLRRGFKEYAALFARTPDVAQ